MTTISIKDLPESVALDRKAMLAISGGARIGGSPNFSRQPVPAVNRIIGYPTGFAAYAVPDVSGQRPGISKHFK
jgi:hypothetical protein